MSEMKPGMMGGAVRAEKLREAATLVGEVLASLNVEKHECPTCGIHKAENIDEVFKAQELEAVVRKLERFARAFAAPRKVV